MADFEEGRQPGELRDVATGAAGRALQGNIELLSTAREVLPFLEREGVAAVRPLLNALSEGVFAVDAGGRIIFANRAAQEMVGQSSAENPSLARVFADDSLNGVLETALNGDVVATDRAVLLHSRGGHIHVLLTAVPVFDGPRVGHVVLVFRDITAGRVLNLSQVDKRRLHSRDRLEMALALNHEVNALLTQLMTEHGAGNILDTALHGAVQLTSADCGVIGLYNPETYTVRYQHSDGFPGELAHLELPLEKTPLGRMYVDRKPTLIADYGSYPLRVPELAEAGARVCLGAPLIAEDSLLGVISVFRLTEDRFGEEERSVLMTLVPVLSAAILKARYEHQLSIYATRDPLTGLANRRVAFETLKAEVNRANRFGEPVSAILLDLDHFKTFNDRYGHLAGDEVLRAVAGVMRDVLPLSERAARTGGEEFMILLPGVSIVEARQRAETLRARLEDLEVEWQQHHLRPTASLGCAEYRLGDSEEEFFARLDGLLYLAKKKGRNRVESE